MYVELAFNVSATIYNNNNINNCKYIIMLRAEITMR